MKRGFTLVEFLGVILLITIISLLVIPKILDLSSNSKNEVDDTTKKLIYSATELYISDNDFYKKLNGNKYCVTVRDLVDKDYLKDSIKVNDKDITDLKSVQITYNKGFKYELVDKEDCVEEMPHSVLADGFTFNKRIKSLASGTEIEYTSEDDSLIQTIEFKSNTNIPTNLSKNNIVDLSEDEDGSIIAYWDSSNSKLTIYSEALIQFNEESAEMFQGLLAVKNIYFNQVDTSQVIMMTSMFGGDKNLQSLDLRSFDTSNVADMSFMFIHCESLQSINLRSFDTSNISYDRSEKYRYGEEMEAMFSNCSSLTSLDLSSFEFGNESSSGEYEMFYNYDLFRDDFNLTCIRVSKKWVNNEDLQEELHTTGTDHFTPDTCPVE